MTLDTFVFKHNPAKVSEDRRDTIFIAVGVIFFILVFIFLFWGVLSFIVLGGAAGALINAKLASIKKKGVNRFGSLTERLVLTTETLTIGEVTYNLSDLKNLQISADDFAGKPNSFVGTSLGVDNEIEFILNGVPHSFQFLVKNRNDSKVLDQIVAAIVKKGL